jgi:hypothetical protein
VVPATGDKVPEPGQDTPDDLPATPAPKELVKPKVDAARTKAGAKVLALDTQDDATQGLALGLVGAQALSAAALKDAALRFDAMTGQWVATAKSSRTRSALERLSLLRQPERAGVALAEVPALSAAAAPYQDIESSALVESVRGRGASAASASIQWGQGKAKKETETVS